MKKLSPSFSQKLNVRVLTPVVLASMMISSTAIAKPPVTAFKNITRHFKKGREAYSPTLGMVALETGLIENIRFFGLYTPAFKSAEDGGGRQYSGDTSKDPTWNVVNLLFPSTGGALGESAAATYVGQFITTPQDVAFLLTYAYKVREGRGKDVKFYENALQYGPKNTQELDAIKSRIKVRKGVQVRNAPRTLKVVEVDEQT